MKNGKVRVTADQNGHIIGVSTNNPEYGYVRVQQQCTLIDTKGWLKIAKRSALIKGKVDELLQVGFSEEQELPGRIVVKESFIPFNLDNPDRDLKIAGDTGVVCRVDDMPIYRQTFYTIDPNAQDELIMHNNTDEIRDVMAATKLINDMADQKTQAPAANSKKKKEAAL